MEGGRDREIERDIEIERYMYTEIEVPRTSSSPHSAIDKHVEETKAYEIDVSTRPLE